MAEPPVTFFIHLFFPLKEHRDNRILPKDKRRAAAPEVDGAGSGVRQVGPFDKLTLISTRPKAFSYVPLRISTTQSDVWSYGIVLWEIFTLGEVPHR